MTNMTTSNQQHALDKASSTTARATVSTRSVDGDFCGDFATHPKTRSTMH